MAWGSVLCHSRFTHDVLRSSCLVYCFTVGKNEIGSVKISFQNKRKSLVKPDDCSRVICSLVEQSSRGIRVCVHWLLTIGRYLHGALFLSWYSPQPGDAVLSSGDGAGDTAGSLTQ